MVRSLYQSGIRARERREYIFVLYKCVLMRVYGSSCVFHERVQII